MNKTVWFYVLGIAAAVVVIIIGVGIYLWSRKSSGACGSDFPPVGGYIRENYRLRGTPAGGGDVGQDANTEEDCYKYCKCSADPQASGYAFLKNNKKCWCEKAPYLNPEWTQENGWYSGTFTK